MKSSDSREVCSADGLRRFRMRAQRVGLAVVVSILAVSCYTMPHLTKIRTSAEPLASYTLGEVYSSATGSVMIERVEGVLLLPGFVVAPVSYLGVYSLPMDRTIWPARYRYEDGPCSGGVYVLTRPDYREETIGVVVAADGSLPCRSPLVQISGVNAGRTWPVESSSAVRDFEARPFVAGTSRDFSRWQLIYEGRTANEIAIEYRQFSEVGRGAEPQPEHYQQLKYDLAQSKKFQFRNTEIEVLEASNVGIRFRVLRDEGKSRRMKTFWDGKPGQR
jgi:hypothetical protein